jgi:hypothetical protein
MTTSGTPLPALLLSAPPFPAPAAAVTLLLLLLLLMETTTLLAAPLPAPLLFPPPYCEAGLDGVPAAVVTTVVVFRFRVLVLVCWAAAETDSTVAGDEAVAAEGDDGADNAEAEPAAGAAVDWLVFP